MPELDPVYEYDDPIWVINVKRINEGGHNKAVLRYYKTPETPVTPMQLTGPGLLIPDAVVKKPKYQPLTNSVTIDNKAA